MTPVSTAVARPADLAEARSVMAASAERGQEVVIKGGGTKQDWGVPGPSPELVVDTTGLDALVAHNHGDLTAVVGAGMALSTLQARLGEAGQWLALDPPSVAEGATVGGLLATGDAGPRRHRYGTMRELAIGATVVLADGTVGRSGGQVIKNVAGYDLAKLLCGSLGTLGLVTEVSLRLHPLAPASATVRAETGPGPATRAVLEVLAGPAMPTAIDWAEGALWVRLEGTTAGVRSQAEEVAAVARRTVGSAEMIEGDAEAAAWTGLGGRAAGGDTVAWAATLPGQLGEAAEALTRAAGEAGVQAELTSRAGLGLHAARLSGGGVAAQAATVVAWREAVARLGGTVVVRRRPPELAALVDLWGPAPEAVTVMRRVKEQLDPSGRLGRGRFSPWW
ncbi:MAG TPA: FAD-binding protein [Acidimicrobiales bacterium]|nr:FAD-binding protein [Acidimicrobiales bacterium]